MCNRLELEVNPFAKAVRKAADVGAYRACWVFAICWLFVDFVGNVKLPKG